jgi:hypothetical protein
MAHAFERQILKPSLARIVGPDCGDHTKSNLRHVAITLLFDGRSLPRMLEQSAKWHAHQCAIDDEVARLSPHLHVEIKWAACLPDWTTPDGKLSVKVLTTQRELTEEGNDGPNPDGTQGLAHCAGGSADDCRFGGHRILSVRTRLEGGLFERLSTVEIAADWRDDERRKLRIVQHSGRANTHPPEEAWQALEAYLAACGDGRLPVQWEEWEPQRRVEATLESVCGYEWSEQGNIEKVIALWEPCLPRRLRGMTPEIMAEFIVNTKTKAA